MTRITKITYVCDRCGTRVEGDMWPTGWHEYELPWKRTDVIPNRLGIVKDTRTGKSHYMLCAECNISLIEWGGFK